jgi:hypothetical protein
MSDTPTNAPSSTPSPAAPPSSPGPSSVPSGGNAPPASRPASGGIQDSSSTDTPSAVFDLSEDFDVDLPETFGEGAQSEPQPVVPASESQQAAQPQVAPQTAQPSPEIAPAASPEGTSVAQDPSQPASIAEMIQAASQHHDQLVEALAKQTFAFSPADVEELEANAVGAMPKLLAKAHLKSQVSTLQMMQNLVPQLIQKEVHRMFQMARAEDTFYKGFPELADQKFRGDIMTAAKAIRAMNPKMPNDQLIMMAGNMVMQMHNVQRAQAAGQASQPPQAAPQQAFAPASNGTIVSQTPTPAANDFWSILSRQDD